MVAMSGDKPVEFDSQKAYKDQEQGEGAWVSLRREDPPFPKSKVCSSMMVERLNCCTSSMDTPQ